MRVVVVGTGRMGTIIRELVVNAKDTELIGFIGSGDKDLLENELPEADVVIDFSHTSMLSAVAAYVKRTGAALVSGTTGYTEEDMSVVSDLGEKAAVLYSANYSLGVAALRRASVMVAAALADFDIEIVETHHNQKADAPSGTAKMLLDAINDQGQYSPVYGREGMCGKRNPREIGVHAVRGGTVAGVHTVSFFGRDEEVSLTHRATSRKIFATGAVAAASRLVTFEPGFYTFDRVMFGEED